MKNILTRLCWPILKFFETKASVANYKNSHRVILLIVGGLFVVLAFGSGASAYYSGEYGGLIPVLVFFSIGLVALVVGALGSNGAVSKLWGTK